MDVNTKKVLIHNLTNSMTVLRFFAEFLTRTGERIHLDELVS